MCRLHNTHSTLPRFSHSVKPASRQGSDAILNITRLGLLTQIPVVAPTGQVSDCVPSAKAGNCMFGLFANSILPREIGVSGLDVKMRIAAPLQIQKPQPPQAGVWCRRWELNPHGHKAHCALNAARLPVPPLRHANATLPLLARFVKLVVFTDHDFLRLDVPLVDVAKTVAGVQQR